MRPFSSWGVYAARLVTAYTPRVLIDSVPVLHFYLFACFVFSFLLVCLFVFSFVCFVFVCFVFCL